MDFFRTDLVNEKRDILQKSGRELPGAESSDESGEGYNLTRVRIKDENGEKLFNRKRGRYVTVDATEEDLRVPSYRQKLASLVAAELIALAGQPKNTLVIGLGNRRIASDALGSEVVDRLLVTRQLLSVMPDETDGRLGCVSAIAPGVLGVTGIESTEAAAALAEKIKPDLIIAIDALASKEVSRICRSIQLTDTGIEPGHGIGNKRLPLNSETLGTRVVAMGAPTVVYAKTIAYETIENFVGHVEPQLPEKTLTDAVNKTVGTCFPGLAVSPKDVDIWVSDIAAILADAINLCVHPKLSLDEIKDFLS